MLSNRCGISSRIASDASGMVARSEDERIGERERTGAREPRGEESREYVRRSESERLRNEVSDQVDSRRREELLTMGW